MKSVEGILSEYDQKAPLYRALARRVQSSLAVSCQQEGIQVHAIEHRLKSRESLQTKLNKPDTSYRSLDDLTDIAGVRVITYYASGVDRVADIVQREYKIDQENSIDKGALLDPDRFGYLSLHYVVSLNEAPRRRPRKRDLNGLQVEIQIRSILQHAWAEIEHDLGYKSKYAVPRKARRTFSRLSGLLELADQEFDGVLLSLQEYAGEIAARPANEIAIDRVSLTQFIQTNDTVKALDERIQQQVELKLVFEERFAESLIEKLNFVGMSKISDLESELKRLSGTIEIMAIDHIRRSAYTRIHHGVGVFYFCSTLLAETADLDRIKKYLEKFSTGDSERQQRIAEKIVQRYQSAVQSKNPAPTKKPTPSKEPTPTSSELAAGQPKSNRRKKSTKPTRPRKLLKKKKPT